MKLEHTVFVHVENAKEAVSKGKCASRGTVRQQNIPAHLTIHCYTKLLVGVGEFLEVELHFMADSYNCVNFNLVQHKEEQQAPSSRVMYIYQMLLWNLCSTFSCAQLYVLC